MSPGGHLLTSIGACAAGAAAGAEPAVIAGVFAGGFLIDLDHVVDYLVFEKQRDLRPSVFLRYHMTGMSRHSVLILHSYELCALMAVTAWWAGWTLLSAYLIGALMHLALDIIFNGELAPRSAGFYSFLYRARHGFRAAALWAKPTRPPLPEGFVSAFFDFRMTGDLLCRVLKLRSRRAPDAVPASRPRN